MNLFEKILNKVLLSESVSEEDVNDAIDNHNRIIINYHSNGEDKNSGARMIEVYAYGLTKSGNPVIRAFEPYGDTTTRVPSWKFFRLDRITAWKPTKQTFDHSADEDYKGLGDFNQNGDETMSVVYKIATFDNGHSDSQDNATDTFVSQPKTKQDVYKTDTEKGIERLKQQIKTPIYPSDIKDADSFGKFAQSDSQSKEKSGPKTKQDIYKTDTEKGMERLGRQIQNPQKNDLSKFDRNGKSKGKKLQDLEKLRQTLDTEKPITLADLSKNLNSTNSSEDDTSSPELYKTDTERRMGRLR